MKKLLVLFLAATAMPLLSLAQGYDFTIKLKGETNKDLLLGYYHSGQQYVYDTFKLDDKGVAEIKGEEDLDGGMYLIAVDGGLVFDFVYAGNEKGFEISTDPKDPYRKAKIKKSKDNELFFALNVKRINILTENNILEDSMKKVGPTEKQVLKAKMQANFEELESFQKELAVNNPGTFTANFINTYRDVEIPEPTPAVVQGKEDFDTLLWKFEYQVEHYFDLVDFSDERLLRTPMFKSKVMRYFSPRFCYQHQDSIVQRAYKVVDLACDGGYEMFKNVLTWIFGRYQDSKIVGFDCIIVGLADRYYLNSEDDQCHADWLKPKQIKNLKEYVDALRYTCMGAKAPPLFGLTPEGKTVSLYNVDAEYTLVYIWSANCGHCKKVTPKFLDVYHDFKGKGFEVIAVNNDRKEIKNDKGEVIKYEDAPDYLEFIKENELDWINITDLYNQSEYRKFYGVNSTPKVFLLDKDKKIVAPRIDHITLRKILMNRLDGMSQEEIDKFLRENGYLDDIEENNEPELDLDQ